MSEVVSDVRGQDDVVDVIKNNLVAGRAEVFKDVATFTVEDTQGLSKMVTLHGERGREGGREGEEERRRGRGREEEGGGNGREKNSEIEPH